MKKKFMKLMSVLVIFSMMFNMLSVAAYASVDDGSAGAEVVNGEGGLDEEQTANDDTNNDEIVSGEAANGKEAAEEEAAEEITVASVDEESGDEEAQVQTVTVWTTVFDPAFFVMEVSWKELGTIEVEGLAAPEEGATVSHDELMALIDADELNEQFASALGYREHYWDALVVEDGAWRLNGYAPWAVRFNSDGGTEVYVMPLEHNSLLAEPNTPEKPGYDFLYWQDEATGEAYDFTAPVTHKLQLTAIWQEATCEHDFTETTLAEASCEENGQKQLVCNTCGYKKTQIIPSNGHNYVKLSDAVDATCATTGKTESWGCDICGTVMMEAMETPKLDHQPMWVEAIPSTCGMHGTSAGEKCSVCGEVIWGLEEQPLLPHNMERTIERPEYPAHCGEDGRTAGTFCLDCGAFITGGEVIPFTGENKYVASFGEDKAATCTENGSTAGKYCNAWSYDSYGNQKYCGNIIEEPTVIEAPGHDYQLVDHKDSSCTAEGVDVYECTRCHDTYDSVISPGEHTIVANDEVAATCTATGLTGGTHCSVCGAEFEAATVVPALGHDWGEWQQTKAPTTEAEGEMTRVCRHDPTHIQTRVIAQISADGDDNAGSLADLNNANNANNGGNTPAAPVEQNPVENDPQNQNDDVNDTVAIVDEDTPLAALPDIEGDEDGDLVIGDNATPLAAAPKTGDSMTFWALLAAVAGAVLLAVNGKRKADK